MSSTLRPLTSGMTPAEVSWTLIPLVTTPFPRSMVWYHPNASAWACNSSGVVTARERSEARRCPWRGGLRATGGLRVPGGEDLVQHRQEGVVPRVPGPEVLAGSLGQHIWGSD